MGLGEGHSICQDLCKRCFTETTLVQIGVGRVGKTTRGNGIIKVYFPGSRHRVPNAFGIF